MFDWFQVLDTFRITGASADEDNSIEDWGSLAQYFIATIKIAPDEYHVVAVDCFSLFYELLNASLEIPTTQSFNIIIGEGWEMTGNLVQEQVEIKIGFELSNKRPPSFVTRLSLHQTLLFVALKTADLVNSLEKIGVSPDYYIKKFPPETFFRKWPS